MAQWLRENPWRQGHLLTLESARSLGLCHSQSPDETAVMVISHDCDLAQEIANEPFCEIVVGRTIGAQDGNFANAKSVRRIHLKITRTPSGGEVVVELDAAAKTAISKERLAIHVPDKSLVLSYNEATKLRAWLSARYRRASFPDEFDRRLTKDAKKVYENLIKIFKATSDDIIAVFFDVDEGAEVNRNGPEDAYELFVSLLYSVDRDPEKAKATAQKSQKK
jgi:hypothetical protein